MNYRADIDGLRALAVGMVIFFHFGLSVFSGGFIGVDIFFVISGYLIGSIIFNQLDNDKFSLIQFYSRRFRRLFPVFALVVVITTVIVWFIMLPQDLWEYGKSLVASSVYLSNVFFYKATGYFDTAAHLKPLLHTWSLSVEEQFYVVFPLLALLLYRFLNKQKIFVLIAVLTFISLIASELFISVDRNAVFYLYPFRAWEMFMGVCLATGSIPQVKRLSYALVLSITGLILIVVPMFAYTKSTVFPGLTALVPALGTALILHVGATQTTVIHHFLSYKLPVFLGKISYSLYLWHWPVFVLFMYRHPREATAVDIIAMLLITITASVLSWKYIEVPFRQGRVVGFKRPWSVLFSVAFISALLLAAGGYLYKSEGAPQRLTPEQQDFARAVAELFGDRSQCKRNNNDILPAIAFCPINNPLESDSYTLIWADSHGGAFKEGLEKAFDNKSALIAWNGGCPPIFDIIKYESALSRREDQECTARNEAIKNLLDQDKRINSVVLLGRWSYYLNGQGVGVDSHNSILLRPEGGSFDQDIDQKAFFLERFDSTVQQLIQRGLKVFIVEQAPEFSRYRAREVAIRLMEGLGDIDQFTTENYTEVVNRQQDVQHLLKKYRQEPQVVILPTHHYLCNEDNCSLMIEDKPVYFDNNHPSRYGSALMSGIFDPLIRYVSDK